jgi:hypothetical protein
LGEEKGCGKEIGVQRDSAEFPPGLPTTVTDYGLRIL